MSSPHYFYLDPEKWSENVQLLGQEANHLCQVLRVNVGSEVELTNGQGLTGLFTVTQVHKKEVLLKKISEQQHPKPLCRPIMALALSKGVRRGFFMEKAAELGAFGIYLWQGDFSQGQLGNSQVLACKRQMIAGAKQAHNPWLPEIKYFPKGLSELLAATESITHRILPWELESVDRMLSFDLLGLSGETIYVLGPEGGFSEQELALLNAAHFQRVSLGERILRCETAAMLCLGLHWWASNIHAKDHV
ncbi:MAG: 16S rRNA (uracil(1498)-N(3))-methyltransferase [Desulfovibrio sp.]|nr:16S rRNA (uracil(1498)-N(3))-methyltransferase [Desulfovibrio sp.]